MQTRVHQDVRFVGDKLLCREPLRVAVTRKSLRYHDCFGRTTNSDLLFPLVENERYGYRAGKQLRAMSLI
jgi:hypothetical protein